MGEFSTLVIGFHPTSELEGMRISKKILDFVGSVAPLLPAQCMRMRPHMAC